MLNGHLDVVGVEGMTHAPFEPVVKDGRLFGRGSTDMKGGVAAMCVAAREALHEGIDGEIIITAVIDEEYASLGTRAVLDAGIRANAAIVTEPTRLSIAPAHRGFAWATIDIDGRAAHGSRYDTGVDAITAAALILAELETLQRDVFPTRQHPLLGRPSLHASTIRGGTGLSTYPAHCTVEIERRTIPGESDTTFRAELDAACARVCARMRGVETTIHMTNAQGPSDVAADAPIVQTLVRAMADEQIPAAIKGMSAWTDCALLNAAGIPAVCFGPGDITLAHADEEYISVDEINAATRVLRRTILDWCSSRVSHATDF
jgi:acetylornithine deacetylase